jgi:hypothetical protein
MPTLAKESFHASEAIHSKLAIGSIVKGYAKQHLNACFKLLNVQ